MSRVAVVSALATICSVVVNAAAAELDSSQTTLGSALEHLRSVLEAKLFGEPLWKYLASLGFIVIALWGARALDWLVTHKLKRWTEKTQTRLDDLIVELLRGPVKVVAFVILLHVGLRLFAWPTWVQDYLSKGLRVLVAWSITYVLVKAVDPILNYWRDSLKADDEKLLDSHLLPLIRKSIKIFIAILAVLFTSQNLGLNITSLLAGLSIGGLALGLAAQDTVANVLGAIAIFLDKPFRVGDRIQFENVDGVVESIGLRSTRIRNLEGHLVTAPNKTVGNATIVNVSRRPHIRTIMDIGITYDTPPNKVQLALEILEKVFREHPMTSDVIVSFTQFADSSLNLKVIHWWKGTDYKEYMAGMRELNLRIKDRFDAAGLSFAFPSRTLYVKQDSSWRVENAATSS
ncbi:MAG TPA: mechanosensitive ion channel family protein [Verrucomicrobiota bacterium]|nr:mechanosensitive ion channel family protein [Verrucomicrobiota bacterium]